MIYFLQKILKIYYYFNELNERTDLWLFMLTIFCRKYREFVLLLTTNTNEMFVEFRVKFLSNALFPNIN